MTTAEIQAIVLREIDKYEQVSFPEAQDAVGEEAKGNLAWEAQDNVILWASMSQEFVDAVLELKRGGTIEFVPMTNLGIIVSGGMLRLPIAKRARRYAKPHWCPVWLQRPKLKRRGKKVTCQNPK